MRYIFCCLYLWFAVIPVWSAATKATMEFDLGTLTWESRSHSGLNQRPVIKNPNRNAEIIGNIYVGERFSVITSVPNWEYLKVQALHLEWNPFDDVIGWIRVQPQERPLIAAACLDQVSKVGARHQWDSLFYLIAMAYGMAPENPDVTAANVFWTLATIGQRTESSLDEAYLAYNRFRGPQSDMLLNARDQLIREMLKRADTHFGQKNPAEAKLWYARILALTPNDINTLYQAAQCHLQLDNPGQAEWLLKRGKFIDPGSEPQTKLSLAIGEIYRLKAEQAYAGELYASAKTNYQKAIEFLPPSADLWARYIESLDRQNLTIKAATALIQARQVTGPDPEYDRLEALLSPKLNELGRFSIQVQHLPDATESYSVLAEMGSVKAADLIALAKTCIQQNQMVQARQVVSELIKVAPDHPQVQALVKQLSQGKSKKTSRAGK